MDSCKKIILPPKTYKSKYWNRNIEHFKKHKNNIFVCSGYGLERLNLDLSVAKTVHIGLVTLFLLDSQFFTANDTYVYTFYNNQLCVHNNELEFLKKVRQSNNPTGAFYLPTDMSQFESHKVAHPGLHHTFHRQKKKFLSTHPLNLGCRGGQSTPLHPWSAMLVKGGTYIRECMCIPSPDSLENRPITCT